MNIKNLLGGMAVASVTLSFSSCSCQSGDQLADFQDTDNDSTAIISGETVTDMIQNISSPVEMANEIKSTGVAFTQSILNKAGRENEYETSFKKAANLGVYAADLGYINTFNKNTVVVDYLSSIKRLSDGIGVGQFLDFGTLTRLAKNSTNLDSLKQLSVNSFNEIDKYLRENNRSNVSTAIVAGTWIEGLNITCSVINQTQNEDLKLRLGEQKKIVDIMAIVLNTYSRTESDFRTMSRLVSELQNIYNDVKITVEYGMPVSKEKDGMIVIEMNEVTHVDITPEVVEAIIAKVTEIRNFVIR